MWAAAPALCIVLGQFNELRRAAEAWVASKQGRVISNYTSFGPNNFCFTRELPNDEAALEGAFRFGSRGDVRTVTLRAFGDQEAEAIAQRLP